VTSRAARPVANAPGTAPCALPAPKTPHDNAVLRRQIEATDRQIDRLVYELYGLTEEEIRIVAKATAR